MQPGAATSICGCSQGVRAGPRPESIRPAQEQRASLPIDAFDERDVDNWSPVANQRPGSAPDLFQPARGFIVNSPYQLDAEFGWSIVQVIIEHIAHMEGEHCT